MPDLAHLNTALLDRMPAQSAAEVKPLLRVLNVAELLRLDLPPREMVLAPWLPSKGLAMAYGPRGIGKTHLTLGIGYAVASGGMFLRWRAPMARKVVILDGEMPAGVLKDRLAVIVASAPTELPHPDFLRIVAMDLQEGDIDLANDADQRALDPILADAELVIVDNISTLARVGRENEAESWLPIQQWALMQRRAGRTVLFMHHAGKGGQQRGTSRREDVLDTVLALRRPQDHRPDEGARFELHFEKNRGFHGDDAKPFEAALGSGGWSTRDLADADMARVVALSAEGMTTRDIAEEMGKSKSAVSRLQKKARDAGLTGDAGHA